MSNRLRHQLELHPDAATLYLAGRLQAGDLPRLRGTCAVLPPAVTMLRVDMHALVAPAPDVVRELRALLQEWRLLRGGTIRLSMRTPHLVASYHEAPHAHPACRVISGHQHALVAAVP